MLYLYFVDQGSFAQRNTAPSHDGAVFVCETLHDLTKAVCVGQASNLFQGQSHLELELGGYPHTLPHSGEPNAWANE